jgi:DNA invertase Pin-like site-specific DNA recombinase
MICHSYARFSTKKQSDGDSLRRQTKLAVDFCERKGWALSSQVYRDLGKSSFKGDRQADLDRLLKAIASGAIRKGETLIVEAIDRLCRKGISSTQNIVSGIFEAGVNIQIFSPHEKWYDASKSRDDIAAAVELAVFAFLSYTESKNKSDRIKSQLEERRRKVRSKEPGETLTNRIPGWLEKRDGKLIVKPEGRRAVEYIFQRTIEGSGRRVLLRELNAKFKPMGTSGAWNATAISLIVNGKRLRTADGRTIVARAVCGESVSTKTGEVFKPYPVIIDEDTWRKAAASSKRRTRKKGPPTSRVNVFAGLLHFAKDGSHGAIFTMYQAPRKDGTKRAVRRFQSYMARNDEPGADKQTIDAERFEEMLFEFLPQLDLSARKPDRRGQLEDEIAVLESQLAEVQQTAKDRPRGAAALATVIATLAEQLEQLRGELAEIPDIATRPTKDYRAKLAAMRRGTNEEREQVRDRLLAIIGEIWVHPIKLGTSASSRVKTIAEIHFKDGSIRRGIEIDGELYQAAAAKSLREQVQGGAMFNAAWYGKAARAIARKTR